MENGIQYGPYSPQEVERISAWLKENKVHFEIARDDQQAKESLMNDGQNLVSLAEFRTNIYLAQIYYITLIDANPEIEATFQEMFSLKPEKSPFSDQISLNDDQDLNVGKIKQQRKKRGWAIVLSLYFVVPIVVSLILLLLKES